MVMSVSAAPDGRTISISPETTTKNGTALSPCSTSTSPGCIARICPCTATRLICCGVNFGNICSRRELLRGRPLDVSLIEVFSRSRRVLFLQDLAEESCFESTICFTSDRPSQFYISFYFFLLD